jgi:hypothetical protein
LSALNKDALKGDPQGYFVVVPPDGESQQANLREIIVRLWRGKLWVIGAMLILGGLAVAHAIWSVPIYRSSAVLAIRDDADGGASALRGQLGSLASIAGIGLGQAGMRRTEFIAFLQSRALAKEFVVSEGLMPILYADRWDAAAKRFRPGEEPAVGDAVQYFTRRIRDVKVDPLTGLVTVAIQWTDPKLAAAWTNGYVALGNRLLREESIATAKQSIAYLDEELGRTAVESIRQSLFRMLESRLHEQMVANVQRDFAFKFIDPAEPSEPRNYIRPRPVVETLVGLMCGFAFGAIFVLWRSPPSGRKVDG